MKYYFLREPSDPEIIGVTNGGSQVEISKEGFDDKEKYERLLKFFDHTKYWSKEDFSPDENFEIEYARMLKGAIATDFLSYRPYLIACPFIVSEKTKLLLEGHAVQQHYYFPVKVYERQTLMNIKYFLLYCPLLDYDIIDFSRASFYSGSPILGMRPLEISSKEEFIGCLSNDPFIKIQHAFLSSQLDPGLDFFSSKFGVFVSERLKKRIEKESLSGIMFPERFVPILESQ